MAKDVAIIIDESVREEASMRLLTELMGKNDLPLKSCAIVDIEDLTPLADIHYWVVVGNAVLTRVRPNLKISTAHGRPFFYGATVHETGEDLVVPVYHPGYVLKMGGKDSETGRDLAKDLRKMANLVLHFKHGGMKKVIGQFPDDCQDCDELASAWTPDGIGYCSEHWSG